MEFGSAQLGDARRTQRLVEVAAALAKAPHGTLPQALPACADLKGAYRLFSNEGFTREDIVRPHVERTFEACSEPGEYLLIEDTTTLDFTKHRALKGAGPISKDDWSLGLLLHSTLALRVHSWDLEEQPQVTALGLLDQQCWARPEVPATEKKKEKDKKKKKKKESRAQILRRSRESERWARVFERVCPPKNCSWTFVADREGDIYEAFARCNEAGADAVIRAAHPRALIDEDQTVFSAVKEAPVMGTFTVSLRTRGEAVARDVTVEVRSTKVTLRGSWRPGGKTPPFEVNVVLVREIGSLDKDPIEWVLLTSLPCDTFAAVKRIVACYARRWMIEEYHKALKTGAQVEQSQLEYADRVEKLLGILAIVAVRLLNTKLLARTTPNTLVDPDQFGPEMIDLLTAKFDKPPGGWTYRTLWRAVARLGGFLARRHDGEPGWITIWRGWRKLQTMAEGVQLLKKCG